MSLKSVANDAQKASTSNANDAVFDALKESEKAERASELAESSASENPNDKGAQPGSEETESS